MDRSVPLQQAPLAVLQMNRWRGPLTASQIPFEPGAFTAPVVDYEPPPYDVTAGPPAPALNVAGSPAPPHNVAGSPAPPHNVAGSPAPPHNVAGSPAPPHNVAGSPAPACPAPTPAALHRPSRRGLRPVERLPVQTAPPPEAAAFADAVLRRVLEVIDRRRPIAQLRPMLTPPLMDMVFTLTRAAGPAKAAVLRRVRL